LKFAILLVQTWERANGLRLQTTAYKVMDEQVIDGANGQGD